ncbi:MAG: hypothetical protein AMJ79_04545 [Phycisphaerae bacterium SM23_30]|nr:MAG: hypothetical protein AMJ79_04545 [Phycisphaerae bacterium SM23_30]
MLRFNKVLILIILSFICMPTKGQVMVEADLALINAKVWTVDRNNPAAQAVAVWNGQILAVGTDRQIKQLIGPDTKVLDLKGRLLLPGFHDSHTHFVTSGFNLMGVDLKDADNEEEFGKRLAAAAQKLPPGAWITGGNWDHDRWPGGKLPTAELIDKFVPDRPVLVSRYDGHMSVANSLALKMASVTAQTPDPPGGIIVRKPNSKEPAGVLRETAASLVSRIIPPHSKAEIRHAIETSLDHARQHGITSIQQVDLEPVELDIYQQLLAEGKLTARIYGFIPLAQRKKLIDLGIKRNFNCDNWITLGGCKAFLDGSLGSSTAMFFEPYTQDPSTCGLYVVDPKLLLQQMLEADKADLQLAIHSIGDKANSDLLDMFAEIIAENGPRDRRLRIEHAQHLHPKDYKRFAQLGVIASMQPYHAIDDGRFAEKRIGAERCKNTYAFKSFLDNHVALAFGSDWDVAPLDALLGIYAADTRRTLDDAHPDGWIPEQKITVPQAIEAYTLTPAYASFSENIKGSITPGKLADMVVLSQDILSIPPAQIENTEIIYTIINGQIVFENRDN